MKYLLRSAVFAAAFLFTTLAQAGRKDQRLDIYWIDVEGGAATMIVTPMGESILIDTGNPNLRDPRRIVETLTRTAGLKQIDHLIITHYHRDHYGGADTLSRLVPINTVYDNGKFKDMPDNPGRAYFSFPCKKRTVINPGDEVKLKQVSGGPHVKLTCLGTRKQFIANAGAPANDTICATAKSKDRDGSDNANSVVSLIDFGSFRFFDAGDLTWNQEKKLVCPKNLIGTVDVYQVTHHGLSSSNNPLVLQTLQPHVAIMNNGKTKGCTPEVFANLQASKSLEAIYQMHKNERPDGAKNNVDQQFIANRRAKETGNIIHLSVAKDARSYTVNIPAYNHKRTYKTRLK